MTLMDFAFSPLILLVQILIGSAVLGFLSAVIVIAVSQARAGRALRDPSLNHAPDATYLRRVGKSLWAFCCHPTTRYVSAWMVAIGVAATSLEDAWHRFDTATGPKGRPDHNNGHTTIDFGGQWLMTRMVVEGEGRHLYHRHRQREVLKRNYLEKDQEPGQKVSDVEVLMSCFMGHDDDQAKQTISSVGLPLISGDALGCLTTLALVQELWQPSATHQVGQAVAPAARDPFGAIAAAAMHDRKLWPTDRVERAQTVDRGGPLYPPINSLYLYPLGLLRPQLAYRVNQILNSLLAFLGGLGISVLARRRIWWPVAAFGILAFPGFKGSVTLGQNATLTLAIAIWGWTLIARDRPVWGGVVWGLLAFKPVWALAFFLVPLLTGRWRTCLTMIATGVALAAATLPFIGGLEGWRVWWDWLQVGKEAALLYNVDENWVFLSRDLLSIPRRWLMDWSPEMPRDERDADWLPTAVVGWSIVLFVFEATVRLAILRKHQARAVTGPPAAFLFLFAWMMCFHFMYYDVLLAALPVFLLLTEPRRYLQPTLLAIRPVSEAQLGGELSGYYRPGLPHGYPPAAPLLQPGYGHVWALNSLILTIIGILLFIEHSLHFMVIEASVRAAFLEFWPIFESWPIHQPLLISGDWKGTPWETFCLLVLWLYCGWLWLRTPQAVAQPIPPGREATAASTVDGAVDAPKLVQLGADVGGPH
jgi:hypothetical protein